MNKMNIYGYTYKIINSAKDFSSIVDSGESSFHFEFKEFDFFYRHRSQDLNTLVVFHAAVSPEVSLPVFRGHDWDIPNTNILCVSDYVLKKYRSFNSSHIPFDSTFFQPTSEISSYDIITEVISFVKSYNSGEIVTFGTSAGGLAALKYSAVFSSLALIGNAEFFLDKWWNFSNTESVINSCGDKIQYPNVESWLKQHGAPKRLVLSSNVFDEMTYDQHHVPLVSLFDRFFPNNIFEIRHCEKHSGKFHTSHFPINTPYKDILKNLSYNNDKAIFLSSDIVQLKSDFLPYSDFVDFISLDEFYSVYQEINVKEVPVVLVIYNDEELLEIASHPFKIDWFFHRKKLSNPIKSKHGVYTISLPFKSFLLQTNNFTIING